MEKRMRGREREFGQKNSSCLRGPSLSNSILHTIRSSMAYTDLFYEVPMPQWLS